MLPEQDTGDDEPGDHKEDVHTHIASAQAWDMSVKQNDEHHCHSSKTLDVGTELAILGCGTRFVPRGLVAQVSWRYVVTNYHLGC